jgi:hypothetical protein
MEHNSTSQNHENENGHTFFDGGGVSAVGYIFVIIGLLVLTWLVIAG